MPTTQQFLSRFVYDSGYYLGYGVVFPTLFVVHIIPGGRRLISGFVDGAAAANDYLKRLPEATLGQPTVAAVSEADGQ